LTQSEVKTDGRKSVKLFLGLVWVVFLPNEMLLSLKKNLILRGMSVVRFRLENMSHDDV